jgi:hypothetical protein
MKTSLSLCCKTAALATCLGLMASAQAATISATAVAKSAQPTPIDVNLDMQNGDFRIAANPAAGPGHFTGDGVDETTTWAFDFTGDPDYAQFISDGQIVAARMSLTLNTAFFVNGVGPITDRTFPSNGVLSVFPLWVMPEFISGTPGSYSSGSIGVSLLTVGMPAADLFNYLVANNGLFPMVYGDDAIVTEARLALVSAPIPEPGTYALIALGLAGVGVAARRRPGQFQKQGSAH